MGPHRTSYGVGSGQLVFPTFPGPVAHQRIDPAAQVGGLLDRRADYPQPREGEATHGHRRVESFAQIGV